VLVIIIVVHILPGSDSVSAASASASASASTTRASNTNAASTGTGTGGASSTKSVTSGTTSTTTITNTNTNNDISPASADEHDYDYQLEIRSANDYDQESHDNIRHDLNDNDTNQSNYDVIIVATIDGSFYGISPQDGQIIWTHNNHNQNRSQDDEQGKGQSQDGTNTNTNPHDLFQPLISTTTTRTNNKTWRTAAVPSIDGRVYLTLGNGNKVGTDDEDNDDDDGTTTVTNSIKDLVDRSPFMDARGRFFAAKKHAYAVALCKETGKVLKVVQAGGTGEKEEEFRLENNIDMDLEDFVWVGRVDYEVTVHDARTGEVDVKFSTSEVLGVEDMLDVRDGIGHGNGHGHGNANSNVNHNNAKVDQHVGGPLSLPVPVNDGSGNGLMDYLPSLQHQHQNQHQQKFQSENKHVPPNQPADLNPPPSLSEMESNIVSTPGGRLAMRDPVSGDVQWISAITFESPIAYAVESGSGTSLGVHIVQDAPMPHLFSEEYVEGEIERQSQEQNYDLMQQHHNHGRARAHAHAHGSAHGSQHDETVFGSLGNGELFALPLGRRAFRNGHGNGTGNGRNGLPHVPRLSSTAGTSAKHLPAKIPPVASHGDWQHGSGFEKEQQHAAAGNTKVAGTALTKVVAPQVCDPNSKNFPTCLAEMYGNAMMEKLMLEQQQQIEQLGSIQMPLPVQHPFYKHTHQKHGGSRHTKGQYQNFMNVMTSWIPPAIALAFVVSFEMGRRAKAEAAKLKQGLEAKEFQGSSESVSFRRELSDENLSSNNEQPGVIHVSEDVLGYGGHGTVVYKGKLDGRFVAVKRMLKAYHASADREISLLIESDGHPNVVRYFLKEVRGDFVYLALELCDMNLQDLIVSLSKQKLKEAMGRQEDPAPENAALNCVNPALRKVLFEIASGIKHIHSLRIVHRDLKPANILLAKNSRRKSRNTFDSEDDVIYDAFKAEKYLPKISDMGLGKQLAGQSSFGFSTFNTSLGPSMNQGSTIAGAGPGSVGWQAPEVMAQRLSPEAASLDGSSGPESMLEASPLDITLNGRTSRSVDIFSLGCIFYCTLLPGSHPFGEWYEREANIMKNRPATDALKEVNIEAWDLVVSMLSRNPKARPTASQICNHPFFWNSTNRLAFLCDFSDRLESDSESKSNYAEGDFDRLLVERQASDIVGLSWTSKIDACLLNNVQKFRSYDASLVRDCLRLIRNKHHHFDELPPEFKVIAPDQKSLLEYFEGRFPCLLFHCYSICRANLKTSDQLAIKYDILRAVRLLTVPRKASSPSSIEKQSSDINGFTNMATKTDPQEKSGIDTDVDADAAAATALEPTLQQEDKISMPEDSSKLEARDSMGASSVSSHSTSRSNFAKDITTWQGSSTAAAINCRGWIRAEDEWILRTNEKIKKRDMNLIRCAEDARYRTRLCNHWDNSQGTYCPMLKKGKCVFAHGPAELRVKEGKKNRWGKLVDVNGNNSNPQHSGGEDTYGAARQIENSRKVEGKWNKTPKKPRGKIKKAAKALT